MVSDYKIKKIIFIFIYYFIWYLVPENDNVYSGTGFPKNFLTFAGKYLEQNISKNSKFLYLHFLLIKLEKNNPEFVTKLFGCNIYLDKSDWLLHCSEDNNPNDEIKFLENKLSHIEQINLNNLSKVKKISEIKKEYLPKEEIDLDSPKIKQQQYDNLINQIYNLQMKQFAESICGIKKENNQNKYIITFDPTEKIQSIELNENEYEELISFRDPLNSISVYDLFQEKTHLYYNTGGTNNKIKIKTNLKKEEIQVAKKIQIKYDYCHHCKQRKPGEVIVQCKSHLIGNKMCQRPIKTFCVNGTTVIRSKIYYFIIY